MLVCQNKEELQAVFVIGGVFEATLAFLKDKHVSPLYVLFLV